MAEKITKRKEYQGFYKDNEGEAHIVDMVSETMRPELDPMDFVTQAPAMRITPSRAKLLPRPDVITRYISIPDSQIGFRDTSEGLITLHDEKVIQIARQAIKALQGDVLVLQGDTIDLPELTRFDPDSTHFTPRTLQMGIDRAAQFKGELRADNPHADMHELEGNHEMRLGRFVLKHAMMLHGLRQAGTTDPVLSYPFLTRNKDLNVEYHDGYPASEYQAEDDLLFIHGKEVASNGSTAKKYSDKYPDTNVVFGHIHRHEVHTRTSRKGIPYTSASFGTLASITGAVPSYGSGVRQNGRPAHTVENWQSGFGVIDKYKEGYQFRFIPILGGVALR
jgi:hypothetical protein